MKILVTLLSVLALVSFGGAGHPSPNPATDRKQTMELGAFSISLAVEDLATSRAFYEKLGFESVMGEPTQNWLIWVSGVPNCHLPLRRSGRAPKR